MASRPALRDTVDQVVAEWQEERPDLLVAPIEVVLRIGRLRTRFDEELAGLFASYDLTAADFAVLASLRRAGRPYELPQSALVQRLGLTSGTVSVRLARLQTKQVVERLPTPEDARGALVRLTDKGAQLFDRVAPAHLHNEDVLLSALTPEQRDQLAGLLRILLVSFERERASSPLGMTLAPAHVARRMRAAVGLSDVPGVLILDVDGGSAAAVAGLRAGDLLVGVNGEPLHSCTALAEHTAASGSLRLELLRGSRRHAVNLDAPRSRA